MMEENKQLKEWTLEEVKAHCSLRSGCDGCIFHQYLEGRSEAHCIFQYETVPENWVLNNGGEESD